MARIVVDDVHDPRFKILGALLGMSRFDARGRLEDVWEYCTDKQAYILSPVIIDAITEHKGFAEALCHPDVGLGEKTEGGVRIKGTKGRIEWLGDFRAGRSKGGKKSAERERDEKGRLLPASPAETQVDSSSDPAGVQVEPSFPPGKGPAHPAATPTVTSTFTSTVTSKNPSRGASAGGSEPAASADDPPETPTEKPGSRVWEAYAEAYQARYREPPVRNARANALCAQLVKRLGAEEAPEVARFYLSHGDQFYAKKGHPLTLLLGDAEKLRTEWRTGQQIRVRPKTREELISEANRELYQRVDRGEA